MDLVQFLRARLDDDEERARFVQREQSDRPQWETEPWRLSWHDEYDLLCIEPARALAEVESKRRIVDAHARPHECIALTGSGGRSVVDGQPWELWEPEQTEDHGPCFVLRCLALPYADHPDYRDDWRP